MRLIQVAAGGSLLFALNFFICHELFRTEYTERVISGDAMYISISRYMLDHWRDLSWWPIWYNGIPGHDSYPPLLHALVALIAGVEHVSPALAHHQFSAVVYALAPAGLFFLTARMTRSVGIALSAGFVFTFLSPSTLLIPWMRANAGGWFGPWRLCVLGAYGDAPHMFGFALMPFAIVALDRAVERPRPLRLFLASLTMSAILLTNWLGSVGLACAIVAYLVATTNNRAGLSRWAITGFVALAAYLLACPWIPPSTLQVVAENGQVAQADYRADMRQFPMRLLAMAAVVALAKVGFLKRKTPVGTQFAAFMVLLGGSFPLLLQWLHVALMPLPDRYVWEMDLSICLLATVVAAALLKKLPRPVTYGLVAAGLLLGGYQLRAYRHYSAALIKPIDMTATIEYKIADWLKRNYPTNRVFAIGTVAYWLNNFSDQPQSSGGFEFGTPNAQDRTALKIVSETASPETTLLWLRALGADLAVVGGPRTQAPFRMFSHPERFDRFAEKVFSDGDDFVYLIPRRSRSLAHIVRRGDTDGMERYVSALEDTSLPLASLAWRDNHSALVTADIPYSDLLSVQITYHRGWHAAVRGSPRRVEKDAMGFMTIDPGCVGPCSVALTYDGGTEATVTHWAASTALLGFVTLSFIELVWRMRRARTIFASLTLLAIPRLPAQSLPQAATIRVPVRLVLAPTLVFTNDGRLIPGLQQSDFRLLDNNRPERIVLDSVATPVSMVIAVQSNRSVRQYVPFIVRTGSVLESLLAGESGQAAVVTYGDDVTVAKPLDSGDLHATLAKISATDRQARMIDAGLRGIALLKESHNSRTRILVFIGQAMDKGSESPLTALREQAESENVTIYALTLPQMGKAFVSDTFSLQGVSNAERGGFEAGVNLGNLVPVLDRSAKADKGQDPFSLLTSATGGTQIHFRKQRELETAIAVIGVELRSSYLLSYWPGSSETGYHTIKVEVDIPGAKVYSRAGYWRAD